MESLLSDFTFKRVTEVKERSLVSSDLTKDGTDDVLLCESVLPVLTGSRAPELLGSESTFTGKDLETFPFAQKVEILSQEVETLSQKVETFLF